MPGTCTVALKMPHGLILRLFDMVDRDELVMGGGTKAVKAAMLRTAEPVQLYGYAKPWDKPYPADRDGNAILVTPTGFALTPNVDADFMAEWMRQNVDHDLVKNRLILVQPRQEGARDMAKEARGVRSGLEPLSPGDKADTRVPRGIRKDGDKEAA